MTIYKPVTEYGKMIASLLKYDDQVRLDIHEYLEGVEPRLIALEEKAKLLETANNRLNDLALKQTKMLQLLEESCSKCILKYHGETCSKRACEFKSMREVLEAET